VPLFGKPICSHAGSSDQAHESDSISNQRHLVDDFLKNHPEIEAISEKVDDGYKR
jgi:hypothetical protein